MCRDHNTQGAVLAQVQPDGTQKPVAFAFRTLSATEQKYSTVEKEALIFYTADRPPCLQIIHKIKKRFPLGEKDNL